MYPSFDFHGVVFYSLWLGIIISALVFLAHMYYGAKMQRLHFSKFFYWLPTGILSIYFIWKWAWLYFDDGILFPMRSLTVLKAFISPYWFNFHFVGIVIGWAFAWRRFFKKVYLKSEIYKWVDVAFFSFAAACVPLWLALLLGDTFIGNATASWYGVSALKNSSEWINFGRVFPLGLLVTTMWILLYTVVFVCKNILRPRATRNRWYLGFSLFFLWCAILFLAEHYTRHIVMSIGSVIFDIKNYVALCISAIFLRKFISTPKKQ